MKAGSEEPEVRCDRSIVSCAQGTFCANWRMSGNKNFPASTRSHTFSSHSYNFTEINIATPSLTRILDRLIGGGMEVPTHLATPHNREHSLSTTRLRMIFQYRGEALKPKSIYSMSLKGTKSAWWCYRLKGPIILRTDALCNQARWRRRDHNFQSSRGLDCSGVIT